MIHISELNKYFFKGRKNEVHVLNNVNLEFDKTGLVCILGESGSGKTTLLNAIGGLDTFNSGKMEIDGITFKKYSERKMESMRNSKFGYIFQNYYLLNDYSVYYNIKIALNSFDISEDEKEERINYVLEKLGMIKYKKKIVGNLSGGQKQRVSIARALVKAPKIILADEPTGNLDEENTLKTMSVLKSISKDCLVILVSHERRIAHFFADRIIEIQDGNVVSDKKNKAKQQYETEDNENIYLLDRKKNEVVSTDVVKIDLYEDENEDEFGKIKLNLAIKNGKIYLQNLSDTEIVFSGEDVGCEMLMEHKPVVEKQEIDDLKFDLKPISKAKKANLSNREIWRMSKANLAVLGKKQVFAFLVLTIFGVLSTFCLANFTGSYYFDKKDVQKVDSHYVDVVSDTPKLSQEDLVNLEYEGEEYEGDTEFTKFMKKNIIEKYGDHIFTSNGGKLMIDCTTYNQLANRGAELTDFSLVKWSELDKKDLIAGKMPEKKNEIAVDRWVVDKFLESDSAFVSQFDGFKSFIGKNLKCTISGKELKITGICDTGEPSIYINEYMGINLTNEKNSYTNLSQLKCDEKGFETTELKKNEILVPESVWKQCEIENKKDITLFNKKNYSIAGYFPDSVDENYVFGDDEAKKVMYNNICENGNFSIYTSNPEKVIKDLKKASKKYDILLFLSHNSKKQYDDYYKKNNKDIFSRNMISLLTIFLTAFVVFFTMKTNVSMRIEELTVYRLIGISKHSIIKSFVLEVVLLVTYTVLPSVLVTAVVFKMISGISSLQLNFAFPWWSIVLLILASYLMNVLLCLEPIKRILSKPPATLSGK